MFTVPVGAAALDVFERRRGEIAAVVTDMMMPGMDGLQLVAKLRTLEPELPLIGISGISDQPSLQRLEALHLAAFLNKPCANERLLTALHDALHPADRAE